MTTTIGCAQSVRMSIHSSSSHSDVTVNTVTTSLGTWSTRKNDLTFGFFPLFFRPSKRCTTFSQPFLSFRYANNWTCPTIDAADLFVRRTRHDGNEIKTIQIEPGTTVAVARATRETSTMTGADDDSRRRLYYPFVGNIIVCRVPQRARALYDAAPRAFH